ncbi:MAG: gamma-glutamyltransferase [Acidiferrobacterales bacterium]|nr:gamma-glutamyltransferase [Acidiferrobacterales bacterium]
MKAAQPVLRILLFFSCLLLSSHAAGAAGVASAHPLATKAGIEILEKGGNAFDAAVAVTAAIAVVEPSGSGIGGGGFWLMHDAFTGKNIMVDGRETAPGKAHRDMYLDEAGEVIPNLSVDGPLAAGIPGEPAAIAWISSVHGNLSLAENLAPAIRYAEEGFAVGEHYQRLMQFRHEVVKASPAAAAIFLDDGNVPEPGWILRQPDLAKVLRALAIEGFDGFYRGEVAETLVHGVQEAGGIWTLEDLADYRVRIREPIEVQYRDMKVTSAALPSSGGLVMAIALNQLAKVELDTLDELAHKHVLVETMRRAYRDRAAYMGDSDFVDVPIARLLGDEHATNLQQSISISKATPSSDLEPVHQDNPKGSDTTHFSIIDNEGNRVSATLSINYPFGSGFVPPGTGVLLNDEMDDFSSKPGVPNVYGLVGNEANAIAPGKRMLSSMSPTFLETEDRIAVIGTPGGSRIISMVLQGALAFHAGASAEKIVSKPRIHHQYLPDRIQYEPDAFTAKEIVQLYVKGHQLHPRGRTWGNMHTVILNKASGEIEAASDPRGEGQASVIE